MSISVHKDYADYAKFMTEVKREAGEAMHVDSFLIDLHDSQVVQHLSLGRLADQLGMHGTVSKT